MTCWNCGDDDHYANACKARQRAAPPPHEAAEGLQVKVSDLRRPPSEICDEDRMHAIVQDIRDHMTHGMPLWLWRRMKACQQVADSRRHRPGVPT